MLKMHRNASLISLLLLCLCLLLLCPGCGSESRLDSTAPALAAAQGHSAAAPESALPALPALPRGRQARGLEETELNGSQSFRRASSALPADPVLALNSSAGETCWGIWELPAVDELRYLEIAMNLPTGQQAWLGLADYSAGRWELVGPVFDGRVLALYPQRHSSPGGLLYAAVLVADGNSAVVQSLRLIAFHSNTAPSADLQADVTSGNAPLLVGFNASASTDPDPGDSILRYLWDFDGDAAFEEITYSPTNVHTLTQPGIINVTVAVEDREGERDTAQLEINVGVAGNSPPGVTITALPLSGSAPLNVSFGSVFTDIDGSIVRFDWDFEGDGTWERYDDAAELNHVYTAGGSFNATLRVTDDDGAQNSDSIQITVNSPPQASLQVLPASIQLGADCFLDAALSSDADGTLTLFEWDLDGDGTYEQSSGTDPQLSFTPASAGPYSIGLRVSDELGAQSTAQALLHVRGWMPTVQAAGEGTNAGRHCSVAIVQGRLAAAFHSVSNGDLMYARATDYLAQDWSEAVVADSDGFTGASTSLAVVNGLPSIAYRDNLDRVLFVQAIDALGDAWGAEVVVQQASAISGISMIEADGVPAVAFDDDTDLLYCRGFDAAGSGWNAPQLLDGSCEPGAGPTLALLGDKPALAYRQTTASGLMFMRALNASGSSWNPPVSADATFGAGEYASLALVDGFPAIAYTNADSRDFRYVRAADSLGDSWGMSVLIDATTDCGRRNDLLFFQGRPVVVYACINGPQELRVREGLDSGGSLWGPALLLDPVNEVSEDVDALVIDGHISLCYDDGEHDDLRAVTYF
ncbi:PKD domain-containing protein [bacterium]|nr:PKD domain-containing protein [bacterium]